MIVANVVALSIALSLLFCRCRSTVFIDALRTADVLPQGITILMPILILVSMICCRRFDAIAFVCVDVIVFMFY